MEALVNDKLLQDSPLPEVPQKSVFPTDSTRLSSLSSPTDKNKRATKGSLNVSGPVEGYAETLRNFWYPVAFSADVKSDTLVS